MDTILEVTNLSKSYGKIQALKSVSLSVPRGSVYGVLGPNGSGKTTLLATIMDILQADSGTYSWLGGIPPDIARRRIGTLLETPNFYHYLNAEQNLRINANIKKLGRNANINEVLRTVRLYERRRSAFSSFSLGMKQRLAIANCLLGTPEILLLDEPTNGLDPEGIAEIRALILNLQQQGITIILASHLLSEVEKVCDTVAVLKYGDLIASGPVASLFGGAAQLDVAAADMAQLQLVLSQLPAVTIVPNFTAGMLTLTLAEDISAAKVNDFCHEQGVTLTHLAPNAHGFERQFMQLTQTSNT